MRLTTHLERTTPSPLAVRGRATLRFLASPVEANIDGRSVKAGHVLEWIDRAGYACAAGWSRAYCVTAYVGNVHFDRPVPVGSIVEASARIIATGRTSMQVLVVVEIADATVGEFARVAHCLLVFVAVNGDKTPRAVPTWRPVSALELDLLDQAERRTELRSRIKRLMEAQQYTRSGTTPRLLLRFLAAPTDVNHGGRVHGGTVMRWIDEAANACTTSWAGRRTAAVYAGGIHFRRPVEIGDLVEVESRILHASPHSMHVATHVRSADPLDGRYVATTSCMSVIVAPHGGRATEVPALPLRTDEDYRLQAHAMDLVSMRAELDEIEIESGA